MAARDDDLALLREQLRLADEESLHLYAALEQQRLRENHVAAAREARMKRMGLHAADVGGQIRRVAESLIPENTDPEDGTPHDTKEMPLLPSGEFSSFDLYVDPNIKHRETVRLLDNTKDERP